MKFFGDKGDEAEKTLSIIKRYEANQICYVGRPGPSLTYLLSNGEAPEGRMRGEDCLGFDPNRLSVASREGEEDWKIYQGRRVLFSFGDKQDEALDAVEAIRQHGFTHSCFVGRPGPSFTYLRK